MVKVSLEGFKPLCFETVVEFDGGEEILVSLKYERLFGYCRRCFSMRHESTECPSYGNKGNRHDAPSQRNHGPEPMNLSYKGAVLSIPKGTSMGNSLIQSGRNKGKRSAYESQEQSVQHKNDAMLRPPKTNQGQRAFGETSRPGSFVGHTGPLAYKKSFTTSINGVKQSAKYGTNHLSENEQKMLSAFLGPMDINEVNASKGKANTKDLSNPQKELIVPKQKARKVLLFQPEADNDVDDMNDNDTIPTEQLEAENEQLQSDLGEFAEDDQFMEDYEGLSMEESSLVPGLEENHEGEDTALPLEEEAKTLEDDISDRKYNEDDEVLLDGREKIMVPAQPENGKHKKIGKSIRALKGASSRKRNVQILASPRKRTASKNQIQSGTVGSPKKRNGTKAAVQIGAILYPEKARKAPGTSGGSLQPKPDIV